MTFYDVLKKLCDEKGTTPTAVCKQIGISTGNTGSWKKGKGTSYSNLIKIADCLGVSVDSLICRSEIDYENSTTAATTPPVSESKAGTTAQSNGCTVIDNLLSRLSPSDRLRALADIIDLIEGKYINKQ